MIYVFLLAALFNWVSVQPQVETRNVYSELAGVNGVSVERTDRGTVIFFDSSLFESGKYILNERSIEITDSVANVLNDLVSDKYLYVEGHTDSVGSESNNQKLSFNRAQQIANRIINKGRGTDRLDVVGFGETKPKCGNETPEGRRCNRRVQIVIIGY